MRPHLTTPRQVMAKNTRSRRLTLLLLFVVFALPILLSWLLFHYTDIGKNPPPREDRVLVRPPRPLPDWPLVNPLDEANVDRRLHGKWSLVYLLNGECREVCRRNLYKMRQLRLATGKYAHRVQRITLVVNNAQDAVTREQLLDYAGQLVAFPADRDEAAVMTLFRLSDDDSPFDQHRLYLVDPLGNLVMSYEPEAQPKLIIKDLKRLLKYSRIG